jgi:cysteine desulfurase
MLINNELGTIQPVKETAEAAHERGILFHTDAVAAYGHIPIDVKDLGVDLMSVSAHKFGGPKGIGFLYVREGLGLKPFMLGGGQERGRRAGTENVPGIVGMARAARLAHDRMDENLKRRRELDKYFLKKFEGLRESLPDIIVRAGGDFDRDDGRLPGCFSLTFPGMDAEELIVRLSMEGICISAGAACASSSEEGSHVLTALGLDKRTVRSSVRITMNEDNTEEETDILFDSLVVKLKKER